MAFTRNEIIGTAPSGSFDLTTLRAEYSISYRLFSNDLDDGPQKAMAYVQQEIATFGDAWTWGNDARPTAFLKKMSVQFAGAATGSDSTDAGVWIATLEYGDPEPENNLDNGENPTNDPLDLRPVVEVQTVQATRAAETAYYIGGYETGGNGQADFLLKQRGAGGTKRQAIVNSTCIHPFDPPPEVDHHRWTVRVMRNFRTANADSIKNNVVNSRAFRLSYRGLTKQVPQYAAKSRDTRISMQRFSGDIDRGIPPFDYLTVELTLDIYDDADETWRLVLLDKGIRRRAWPGDPDGNGDVIYEDPKEGQPASAAIVDDDDIPINEPVAFNGNGQPLDFSNPFVLPDLVYGTWKYYAEDDMTQWDIFQGLITAT